jgi:hypothetical protein
MPQPKQAGNSPAQNSNPRYLFGLMIFVFNTARVAADFVSTGIKLNQKGFDVHVPSNNSLTEAPNSPEAKMTPRQKFEVGILVTLGIVVLAIPTAVTVYCVYSRLCGPGKKPPLESGAAEGTALIQNGATK